MTAQSFPLLLGFLLFLFALAMFRQKRGRTRLRLSRLQGEVLALLLLYFVLLPWLHFYWASVLFLCPLFWRLGLARLWMNLLLSFLLPLALLLFFRQLFLIHLP